MHARYIVPKLGESFKADEHIVNLVVPVVFTSIRPYFHIIAHISALSLVANTISARVACCFWEEHAYITTLGLLGSFADAIESIITINP